MSLWRFLISYIQNEYDRANLTARVTRSEVMLKN